jgi:hypothetical protein
MILVPILVVLVARWIAYAVQPSPTAHLLESRAGGPVLPVVALTTLALGAALAVVVCWLAALAVRERALVERRSAEPFAVRGTLLLACSFALVAYLGGGLLEAYVHWRAGLGWHGLHCLAGPVHMNLLPLETGLSFVAAALVAAARHVVAWMRRTFARLRAVLPRLWFENARAPSFAPVLRCALEVGSAAARAPPASG